MAFGSPASAIAVQYWLVTFGHHLLPSHYFHSLYDNGIYVKRLSRSGKRKMVVEALEDRRLLAADPIISEFMASNGSTILDGNGGASDWIEIYNKGDQAINLGGYSLTDDFEDPNKWVFPSTDLAAGQFLLVFASGDNAPDGSGNLHTNFKLSGSGEYLAFVDPAGTTLSEFGPNGADFPAQISDVSYGLGFTSNVSTVVTTDSSSKYLVPTNGTVDGTWTDLNFNDASWSSGTAALGYENNTGSTTSYAPHIQTTLPASETVYVRIPFTVTDSMAVLDTLRLQYDDGFVAYVNGQQVASANAPASPNFQSTATNQNPDGLALAGATFDVSAFSNAMVMGDNVLAIRMLNTSDSSSDFLLTAALDVTSGTITDTGVNGTLLSPSPGLPNSPLLANSVSFSREGGAFLGSFNLELTTPDSTETIRYTTNGAAPSANSTVYTGPITISNRTEVRARAYGAAGQVGESSSETYTPTIASTNSFTSDLPIVVIENFNQGVPGTNGFEDAVFSLYEVDPTTGRSAIANTADLSMNMGLQRRGSSTAGNAKTNYRLELRDENGEDQSVSLLGMPAESDWILYAPYSFDRAMVRDTYFFDISNQMGRYAPRTRFVEVYANTNNGTLNGNDYMGTYVFMENVKRDANRVDISKLSPGDNSGSEITGGYIIKIDRTDGATDGAWQSNRGNPTADGNNDFVHVEPERADMTQAQVNYIRNYINEFETALYGPNSTDPELGYEAYLDVDAAIDFHIVKTLSKDPDALRLSTYLYKDRDGKLTFGPQWDFDRSASPDGDGRASNPTTWDANEAPFFGYDWWGELFDDPDFMQRWVDRWQELRGTVLSDANIAATIDGQAAEIAESQVRNFQEWPNVAPNGGTYASPGLSGWEAEVSHFKNWVITRAQWMDTQTTTAPTISPDSGNVANGTQIELTSAVADHTIYYTLDGTDPRAEGGGVAPSAIEYTGPLTVSSATTVKARSFGMSGGGNGNVFSDSSYPSNESPSDGIDNSVGTKYLNFGEENSGIIISTGSSTVRSIRLTTANDAVERDPTSWKLYGTNQAIASTDNSTGLAETWTLIDSGSVSLPNSRNTAGPVIPVSNNTSYSSYKLLFPNVKNAGSANSMQVAEISFHSSSNGTGADIISPFDLALAVHEGSSTPTTNGLSLWSQLVSGVYATAVPANASNLRLTELHYHPANPTAAELAVIPLATDDEFEFIELANVSSNLISLVGLEFTLGVEFDFNNSSITTLQPGEKILLVENIAGFEARYGMGQPVGGQYAGKLANGGERITLVDASGQVIHDFLYDDADSWPVAADGSGPSMEVIDVFGSYNTASNWRSSAVTNGTPNEIPGDLTGDARLACDDVNLVSAFALAGNNDAGFDMNGDGLVNGDDVAYWVTTLRGTLPGDANADGTINGDDFAVWNANRFTNTTAYCNGDFNTDGIVDVSDFNLWNTSQNAFAAAAAVRVDPQISVFDTNRDGIVSSIDALHVINRLNDATDQPYDTTLDANGDGYISPLDALMVINRLNDRTANSSSSINSPNVDAFFEQDDEDELGADWIAEF